MRVRFYNFLWLVIDDIKYVVDWSGTEEGGHTLHTAKNNFSETSVSKVLLALS